MFCQLHDTHGIAVGMQEGACIVCGQHTAKAKRAHLELIWQILGEPGVGLDACNGDPVGRVAHKDLAHHVQALPGDVQVCGEAVLHPHDPLQPCTVHVNFLAWHLCFVQWNQLALFTALHVRTLLPVVGAAASGT